MKNNGLSVAGFVLSILSWVIFSIILGPLGLILSIVGRNKAVQYGDKTGLATAGIVISALCVAVLFISFFI